MPMTMPAILPFTSPTITPTSVADQGVTQSCLLGSKGSSDAPH